MVLKPSEKVPFTMTKVVELLKEAGLPDGVVNLVNGTSEGKDTTNHQLEEILMPGSKPP